MGQPLVLSRSRSLKQKSVECRGWIPCIRERSKVVALINYYSSEDAEVEETSPPNMMKLLGPASPLSGVL